MERVSAEDERRGLAETDRLPPLMQDRAFHGINLTQFLGAFNDNLFKQLMLLLAIPAGAAAATEQDQQGLATAVFSLPFLLFSGYAGFLSDRFAKRTVIVLSKVAEIGVMGLGAAAFLAFHSTGYAGLLVVLFLMGTQSAFFGPGKYGILPEIFRATDLPRANGIILMTTFLAIILGMASAGRFGELLIRPDVALSESASRLAWGSVACVLIAVVGTGTSLLIRRVPAAVPDLAFHPSTLAIPADALRTLRQDRLLMASLLASSMFWLISGIAAQAVNSLGMVQLQLGLGKTSLMTAMIGLGIAVGAILAGRLCHQRPDFRVVRWGLWGILGLLLLLSISLPNGQHLLGFSGSIPVLMLLGVSAACFAIPIQVFIQARPPADLKGRMIAVMNQFNFLAILFSGLLYQGFDRLLVWCDGARSLLFAMMAIFVIPLLIWYHPHANPASRED
jgi:acyl-[acyl-carrier-protein]-phospholipid O-acyltransferase/long-chain-fatty-acid--[acyl-carrier-protein] ligase